MLACGVRLCSRASREGRLHGMAACGAVPGLGKRRGEGKEGRGKTKKASIATGWALLGRGTIAGFLNGLHAEIHPGDAIHSIIPKVLQENHRWLWRKPRTDGGMQCNAGDGAKETKWPSSPRKPRGDGGRSRQGQTGSGEEGGKEERSKGKA